MRLFWNRNIHVIGDSHASFCFTGRNSIAPTIEYTHYIYSLPGKNIYFPVTISWLGAKTMYGIGRDGLDYNKYGVKNGDIMVFIFGEIDIRCHIGRILDQKKKSEEEIINELATSFINRIINNKKKYKDLFCIVSMVIAPTDYFSNPKFPVYGTLQDRINFTKKLNAALQKECSENGISILNSFEYFTNQDGSLKKETSDHLVHINPDLNYIVKNELSKLLLKNPGEKHVSRWWKVWNKKFMWKNIINNQAKRR